MINTTKFNTFVLSMPLLPKCLCLNSEIRIWSCDDFAVEYFTHTIKARHFIGRSYIHYDSCCEKKLLLRSF